MAEGRVILLTGCTRGLGRALVDRFVEGGHRVLGCGRSARQIEGLHHQYGPPHDFAVVDVSRNGEVAAWAARLLPAHGAPDLVINNAALINRSAPLWELGAAEFDAIIDVNLKGVANVIRHFVPAMAANRRGIIVNISSGWGRSVDANVAPYCATKFAIEGLSKALAREVPAGMAAVPLSPGIIDTDMLRGSWGAEAGRYPSADEWSRRAAPFILRLSPKDNGQSLSIR
jgi:NAD(P)-dependent dehydrogenase (short-subunit alcohol dehydrogenase family)